MSQEEGRLVDFIVMCTLIVSTIFLLLWILWKASTFLVSNILIIGRPNEYINDQITLFSEEDVTVREEMQMVVFDIESQFRR